MAKRVAIAAPRLEDIPPPTHDTELRLKLKVVTPILGGAVRTREIDEVDIVRASGIRGQLRYWWRALYGHRHETPRALYESESELWGGVAQVKGRAESMPRRSRVSVRVEVQASGQRDTSEVRPGAAGAYALFPARAESGTGGSPGLPTAPRRSPGTTFVLAVRFPAVCPRTDEIKTSIAAWVLLGGIGGRTRRGLGALEPTDGLESVLGQRSPKEFLKDLCGPLESVAASRDFPSLAGARCYFSEPSDIAFDKWVEAVGWVSAFRQKPNLARDPDPGGPGRPRPGRSRWPESDLVRRAAGARVGEVRFAHVVRYGGSFAFPRAQFGLPILSRWQQKDRSGQPYPRSEPGKSYELNLDGYERLASPLIVKPFWTGKNAWVSLALWLTRKDPDANVVIRGRPDHAAQLSAMPSEPTHPEFAGVGSVRDAFFRWLSKTNGRVTR
jgi:CRISPR-associated protein Cmr1